jgi:hypothetical protein
MFFAKTHGAQEAGHAARRRVDRLFRDSDNEML